MSDLQITSLCENNTENPLNKVERIDETSDLWLWNLKENTNTPWSSRTQRTVPDTKSWHSQVACVISDSSSVSVFGCCMNEVSWGKCYFVSVRSFDCGVFDVDGSVLDTEVEGGRDNMWQHWQFRLQVCPELSGKTATSKIPLPLTMKEGFILIVQQREEKTNKGKITF